ncbi:hypothetical protein HHI36_017100 [Cryptolaemus montrouzieri]|uniref:Uncharacterized protein n=1 Tax=Cryptolaemus montrouzieri TaxID=559131 RepID=A0ABD2NLT9_9CUCU
MDRDHNNSIVKVSVENIVTEKSTDPGLMKNVSDFLGRIEEKKEVAAKKSSVEKRRLERIHLMLSTIKKLRRGRKFLKKNFRIVLLIKNLQEDLKLDEELDVSDDDDGVEVIIKPS